MSILTWPDRPTCHDEDQRAQRFAGPPVTEDQKVFAEKIGFGTWLEPRVDVAGDYKRHAPFRTCWYCGSIHPQDLYWHLNNWHHAMVGNPLSGSDWKYGWPHKFYVHGIPNLRAGELEYIYTYCGIREELLDDAMEGFKPELTGNVWRVVSGEMKSPTYLHAKWYNIHLLDLNDDAFAALAPLLDKYVGICFERSNNEGHRDLKYRTSYGEYQAYR